MSASTDLRHPRAALVRNLLDLASAGDPLVVLVGAEPGAPPCPADGPAGRPPRPGELVVVEAGERPLVEVVLDVDVPPSATGIAVVATGRAWPMPATAGGAPDAPPEAVECVQLADRCHGAIGALRRADDEPVLAADEPGAPLGGRLTDALRRALGQATPPAAEPTSVLWAAAWLQAVLDVGPAAPWTAHAAAHPAVELLGLEAVAGSLAGLDWSSVPGLASLGRGLTRRAGGWEELRRACVDERWVVPGVAPGLAARMDEGMFAREVLGGYAPLPALLDTVEATLPTVLADRVRQALHQWMPGIVAR